MGKPLLCEALERYREYIYPFGTIHRRFTEAISMWLEDLNEVGVDIEEYIQQEIAIGRGEPELGMATQIRQSIYFLMLGPSLVLIKRGSCPKDWKFDWDPDVERLAGEFWRLVEGPKWQV